MTSHILTYSNNVVSIILEKKAFLQKPALTNQKKYKIFHNNKSLQLDLLKYLLYQLAHSKLCINFRDPDKAHRSKESFQHHRAHYFVQT